MNEKQLVARVRELFSNRIGDDAAVIDGQVFTTDLLVEDVDFTRAIAPRFIARKSLAVNLSDLAAMGAAPSYALLALALPPWALEHIDEMLNAYAEAAREYGIEIIGGDLSKAAKLTISITAIGRIVTRPLLRSGAKAGDRIYLSRPIGGSGAGLALLGKDGAAYAHREFIESAIRRHVDPEPELALGLALAQIAEVTSCIDVSDGLSTDLHHLCDASGCGAEIEKERIPVFPDLQTYAGKLGIDVRDVVLHGGEEYALLFTSSLPESQLSERVGRPVYAIGRMTTEREVLLKEDSVARPLAPGGWDHFAR
ncbi:MAG TPA: thiamine-phosphate kinase [Thermoanaerobaculia bacterium]|jgi:thiamine-monophosphate kinase|nr:thiamine-phosphate kinase [Thermoanaerobaculia bacterium]